ncbi:zinc ribbon domain-containing protein [candidate division KSB1 bacterium]|nr:zinc ribbon domain-containing protein [candidate division KSB1 bacterium]
MKTSKFFAQKFQMLIALCFAMTLLSFPLWAQETKPMEKRYCPYCGIANLKASKFCNACGTRLPDRMPLLLSEAAVHQRDSLETASPAQDWTEPNYRSRGSAEGCMAAGLLAGTIGFFGGGLVGAKIDQASSDGYEEWDGLYGFVVGAPIGESLLLPVGVHLANGRRGNLPLAVLASVGIAGTGIAMAASAGDAKILVAIPIAQLLACTAIERSTSRNAE